MSAILRRALQLTQRGMLLFGRAIPEHLLLVLLNVAVFTALLHLPWKLVLPTERSVEFDVRLITLLGTLPASHWLASLLFLLQAKQRDQQMSLGTACRLGLRNAAKAWPFVVLAFGLTIVPLWTIATLRESMFILGLVTLILFWTCVITLFPVLVSACVLEQESWTNKLAQQWRSKGANGTVVFASTTVLFSLGCILACVLVTALWRQFGLNDFQVSFLVLTTVAGLPLSGQVAAYEQ